MSEVIHLEISLDADKRTVAAILVANGYTVRKTKVKQGNREKAVLEAYKDGKVTEDKK